MHREVEDNTVIFTAFNRKLLRDLEELRNLLVRNKPERVMKKLNDFLGLFLIIRFFISFLIS